MSFRESQPQSLKQLLSAALSGFDKDILKRFYALTLDQLLTFSIFTPIHMAMDQPHMPPRLMQRNRYSAGVDPYIYIYERDLVVLHDSIFRYRMDFPGSCAPNA